MAITNLQQGANLEANRHWVFSTRDFDFIAGFVDQAHLWAHYFRSTTAFRIDNHQGRQARDLIHLFGNGQAFFDILEFNRTCELGNDRTRERIPIGQDFAGFDGFVRLDRQGRTVRHFMAFALAAEVVVNDDFA